MESRQLVGRPDPNMVIEEQKAYTFGWLEAIF